MTGRASSHRTPLHLVMATAGAAFLAGCAFRGAPLSPAPSNISAWTAGGDSVVIDLSRGGFVTVFELTSAGGLNLLFPALDGPPEQSDPGRHVFGLPDQPVLQGIPAPRSAAPVRSSVTCSSAQATTSPVRTGAADKAFARPTCAVTHLRPPTVQSRSATRIVVVTGAPPGTAALKKTIERFRPFGPPPERRTGVRETVSDVAMALVERLGDPRTDGFAVVTPPG